MLKSEVNRSFIQLFSGWKGILHILFWLTHLLIRTFFSQYYGESVLDNFLIELTELPVKMMIAYLAIYLIEHFIINSKLSAFVFGLVLNLILAWFLKRLQDSLVTVPILTTDDVMQYFEFLNITDGFYQLIYIYPTVAGIIALTFIIEWFHKEKRNRELILLNTQNELRYLKNQIQPHFLFNTLNNMYALSLDSSAKTSEVILQLSDLLSFMLYQADKPSISLKDEIDIIQNLYQLESLRSSQAINFKFDKMIEDIETSVPPLLLFPLAENAFKYGIGDDEGGNTIKFTLTQDEGQIIFKTYNEVKKEFKTDQNRNQGLGLITLRRRLELLFPEKYSLVNEKINGEFHSTLMLKDL